MSRTVGPVCRFIQVSLKKYPLLSWATVKANNEIRGRLEAMCHGLNAVSYTGKDKATVNLHLDPNIILRFHPRNTTVDEVLCQFLFFFSASLRSNEGLILYHSSYSKTVTICKIKRPY